ncbi:MAG: RNA polymerase sigma factor [Gemmatimonadales bacterium]
MTSTDATLVDRLAAGDAAALGEMIERHGPPLLRFAAHYLRSAADADEVLQDVFLRADGAIRRGVRPERLDGWLFRITINRCRSRRRKWWPFVAGASADAALATAASAIHVEPDEWREEIERAMATLTPPLREAFLLKHVEGMSYQEMREATGASIPALKMRVARACEHLRGILGEARG